MVIESSALSQILDVFKETKAKLVGMVAWNGNLYFISMDKSNVCFTSMMINNIKIESEFSLIFEIDLLSKYAKTLKPEITFYSRKGGVLIESGKIRHTLSLQTEDSELTPLMESDLDKLGMNKVENSVVYSVKSDDFKEVISTITTLGFYESILFKPKSESIEVSALTQGGSNITYIDFEAKVKSNGAISECVISPSYFKSLNVFDGEFEIEIPESESMRFRQIDLKIGKSEYNTRVIIVIASLAETGEQQPKEEEKEEAFSDIIEKVDDDDKPPQLEIDDDDFDESEFEDDEEDEEDAISDGAD